MQAIPQTNVDDYIDQFDGEVKKRLILLRALILELSPDAVESISYGMPAYKLGKKPFVYFAGFAKHVGFYALPTTHAKFKSELSKYKTGKGSVQFPNDQAFPIELIKELVFFRLLEMGH